MTGRKILFSATKNEGRFLLEWIAYAKVLGFTDIFIFSNDCTDGSNLMLDRLEDANILRHFRQTLPEGIGAQDNAGRLAIEAGLFRAGDWVMWMDPDEYLVPHVGDGTLDGLIQAIDGYDAISIGWRLFGDGGNAVWPGRHVSPALTLARAHSDDLHPQVKTLFRWRDDIVVFHPHRPMLPPQTRPEDFRILTSTGAPGTWRKRTRDNLAIPYKSLRTPGDWWKLAQVNHYCVRTPDVFAEKKARGRGSIAADQDSPHYSQRYYRRMNANDVEDRRILRYETATTEMVARLETLLEPS
ncbi:glycosyltransferase family 2 protein [Jannaschia marina]|uniref:glycosyltransferase family 2 protein n=1 Tax=Jannaschia marina TaxID=2741674 RepID=UPI0015CCFF0B|nr:glycosyltransferase family 2 protein [Jannaschia marina]